MSNNNLEQILEMLLSEDTQAAKEALHEYVVAKAREQYERVLDESEIFDEADCDDRSDESGAFKSGVTAADLDEEELESDMYEEADEEEDLFDVEPELDSHEEDHGDDDIADKVDDLEDELEELRAEFEKLLADEENDEEADEEADEEHDEEHDEEADEIEMESIDLDEATSFSDKVAEQPMSGAKGLKGSESDSDESPFSHPPKHTKVDGAGTPIEIKDGGEGDLGDNKAADHTPEDNIDVPSKAEKAGNSL